MIDTSKITEETIIEYNKRFANGEQYITITPLGKIETIDKHYYWQQREVYNHILPIVERYKSNLTEQSIYGKNGLVARLIPYQRTYNAIKNREMEYINRLTLGVLCVEDGSVDTDNLEEDGVAPSKIIVYRQGAEKPTLVTYELKTQSYIDSANECLKQMMYIAKKFADAHKNQC